MRNAFRLASFARIAARTLTLVLTLMAATAVRAQSPAPSQGASPSKAAATKGKAAISKASPAKEAPTKDAPTKARVKPPQKIRDGAMLKRDISLEPTPEVRGSWEKTRDRLVVTHYRRLARLDAIEQVASDRNDLGLVEAVEAVRRREMQRFRVTMLRFGDQARARDLVGVE